jgi:ankyrin repeat protein
LDCHAIVNAKNNLTGGTPLHMVIQSHKMNERQKERVVYLLLQGGADPSIVDNYGTLPVDYLKQNSEFLPSWVHLLEPQPPEMFKAIRTHNATQCKELAADPEHCNQRYRGHTPLTYAVEELHNAKEEHEMITLAAIVQVLLQAGCDPTAVHTSNEHSEPLLAQILSLLRNAYLPQPNQQSSALRQALEQLVLCFAQHPNGSALLSDTSVTFLLHDAARRNEVDMMRFLLDSLQVNPNTPHRQKDMTPLHFAARSGQVEATHILLQHFDTNVHAVDAQQHTALDAARSNGRDAIVATLQEHMSQHPAPSSS